MTVHTNTVTPAMLEIAQAISKNFGAPYYLGGGTALALHIGHRKSVDLDYFSNEPIDTTSLKKQLTDSFGAVEVTFEEKNTLWTTIDGVKVSFISRFETLLDEPVDTDGLVLAGVRDITIMKLNAICGREEYKDYFDLACLTQHTDIRSWMSWWEAVYPNQDATSWLVALGAVGSVPSVPLETGDAYENLSVPNTLLQAARDITKHAERMLGG